MQTKVTRRAALQAVGTMAATLYGTVVDGQSGRIMALALDDISRIELRYKGRTVIVDPAAVLDALASGK